MQITLKKHTRVKSPTHGMVFVIIGSLDDLHGDGFTYRLMPLQRHLDSPRRWRSYQSFLSQRAYDQYGWVVVDPLQGALDSLLPKTTI
jgi:hypothetical protein